MFAALGQEGKGTETASIITSSHTSPRALPRRPRIALRGDEGRAAAHGTRPQLVGRAPFRTLSTPQLAVPVGTQAPNRTKQGTRNKDGIDAIPGPRGRFVAG